MKVCAIIIGITENDKNKFQNYLLPNYNFIDIEKKNIFKKTISNDDIIFGYDESITSDIKLCIEYIDDRYEKELIKYRIKNNIESICEGNYDLSNINYNKIKKNKYNLIDKYKFKKVNLTKFYSIFSSKKIVYIGSSKLYKNNIPIKSLRKNINRLGVKKIIKNVPISGYDSRWLGLLSISNYKNLKKGVIEEENISIPFIEENKKKEFSYLECSGYLYTVIINNYEQNGYKYDIYDDAFIIDCEEINNIKSELKNENIKFIKKK